MRIIRSRQDLIDWLIKNCPRRAITNALINDRVEHLGGFKQIPPSALPGWILKVSGINKIWYITILINQHKHDYEIRIIKEVPWENWDGIANPDFCRSTLFSGDKPEEYLEKRNEACRRSVKD